ncbi:MAG: type II secretion system F family protein [Atopobiaceae bacterium]|jgi:type IV pilus assembly protein PilC|nr:type II secretion system F family protein [Atopobiaceae bacterium]
MKTFKYTARTDAGATVDGVVEANTQAEAVDSLKQEGLVVSTVEEASGAHDIDLRLGGKKTKEKSLAIMCNQFAIILEAGIPIVRALQLVSDQTEDKTLKVILSEVASEAAAGYGLADSFEKHGTNLPTTFVETVRAGEESGNLDVVFRRLSSYYEKVSRTKGKVKSAMIYPCFVMGVAVVVVAVIMVFAVPTFKTTFQSMGTQLPWITQFMIDSSDFWTNNFLIIAIIIAIAVLGVKALKRGNDDFRLKWSRLGTRVPVIGRIVRMSAAAQYAGTMSVMMEAGLTVAKAVGVTAKSINNEYMANALASTEPDLEAGKTLATSLAKTEAYPELVTEMTGVGEQTGSLEHTLEVLSEYYDNEVDVASARALSLLEPIIIIVLAVIVCGILLSVYLPMFSIYGGYTNAT